MNDLRQHPRIRAAARTLLLIHISFMAGILALVAVALLRGPAAEAADRSETRAHLKLPILSYIAGAYGIMMIPAALGLKRLVDNKLMTKLRQSDPNVDVVEYFARSYFVGGVVAAALLEGAALFNTTVFMIEARLISIAFTGVMVMALAMLTPTLDRTAQWVEARIRDFENAATR